MKQSTLPPWFLAIVFTLALTLLAFFSRRALGYVPLRWADFAGLVFDPWAAGIAIQGLLAPVALLTFFSSTAVFRRHINLETQPGDGRRFFLALASIQTAVLLLYALTDANPLLVLPVVFIGGWLGGWRAGGGLGLLTMLVVGGVDFARYYEPARLWAENGPLLLLDGELWLFLFMLNVTAVVPIWAGCTAGAIAAALDERQFEPASALVTAILLICLSGLFIAVQLPQPGEQTSAILAFALVTGLFTAGLMLLIRSAQGEAARRRAQAAELALAQAELRALRAQINPHFLFNALTTIRYFVRTDPPTARHLLAHLSLVFQQALRAGDFVPLRDELGYVEAYLALEAARFGERLHVCWQINGRELDYLPENGLPLIQVPTLILQPIVENAVVHGAGKRPSDGQVCIKITQETGKVRLQVTDNGPGIEPSRLAALLSDEPAVGERPSLGLRNVDGRLRALYGRDAGLEFSSRPGEGVCVRFIIPE